MPPESPQFKKGPRSSVNAYDDLIPLKPVKLGEPGYHEKPDFLLHEFLTNWKEHAE
jgi:hypothetical protein